MKKEKTPFLVKFAIMTTVTVVVSVFLQILISVRKTPDIDITPKITKPFVFDVDEQFVIDYQSRP